jgi:hypothetical protein
MAPWAERLWQLSSLRTGLFCMAETVIRETQRQEMALTGQGRGLSGFRNCEQAKNC